MKISEKSKLISPDNTHLADIQSGRGRASWSLSVEREGIQPPGIVEGANPPSET